MHDYEYHTLHFSAGKTQVDVQVYKFENPTWDSNYDI